MSPHVTPFDSLISDLVQHNLGNPAFPAPPSSIGIQALPHLRLLRVIYLYFPHTEGTEEIMRKSDSWSTFPPELKNASMADDVYVCRSIYFSFIDALNQAGRHLKKVGFLPPLYHRLHFFRNKVVEHWDDYLSKKPGGGSIGKGGSIKVPIIFGEARVEIAKMEAARLALVNEFVARNTNLSLANEYYADYAEKIWPALKAIENEINLRCNKRPEGSCSPKCKNCKLVNLLFAYEFPLPFYDVEAYCSGFVDELRAVSF